MSDLVNRIIERTLAEGSHFLDLGNCDIKAIPEEVLGLPPSITAINFGSYYKKDDLTGWRRSRNSGGENDLNGNEASLALLTGCISLSTLHLYECGIGEKGAAEIGKLTSLTNLGISDNSIGDKGAVEIGKLTSLTNLTISGNSIGDKGATEIGKLTSLTDLDISYNSIGDKGAVEIGKLTSLTNLTISGSSIGEKGAAEIGKLTSLTNLNISYNSIGDKGAAEIGKLTSLTNLNISDNSIGDKGAAGIGKLTSLTNLTISGNSIGDKGATEIGKLTSLTNLTISGNSIGDKGAAGIGKLTFLTSLDISDNSIGDKGAAGIGKLTSLTSLDISDNSIGDKGAAGIGKLTSLTSLDISDNSISDKGAAGIGKLTSLTNLDISDNSIGDKGAAGIGKLQGLIFLDISFNRITQARRLCDLYVLLQLHLYGNPIRDVPDHVFQEFNCIDGLRVWDAELRAADKLLTNELVKLQVMGNGGAGKSSLIEALKKGLCGKTFRSTHGIEVDQLKFEVQGKPVLFHYWDFGGQEIYHGTHRLFISSQAIHLLVADNETEKQARTRQRVPDRERSEELVLHQPLQHYINTSMRLSVDSHRIVVQSKAGLDQVAPLPDLAAVADQNGIEHLPVDALTGAGIADLCQKLASARTEVRHYGLPMPSTWVAAQQYFIENRASSVVDRRRWMSHDKFVSVCKRFDVSEASAPGLLSFLHHTGLVYQSKEWLKDVIILDQGWALEAIYRPLDRTSAFYAELRNELRGRVQVKRLFEAFGHGYELEAKWLFLGFMRSCGLCFPVNDNREMETEESYYILPEFLPESITPSAARLWEHVGSAERFEYRPAYLDYFTVQQFIVAIGRKTRVELIWRNGVVIETGSGMIRVETDERMTKLMVTMEAGAVNRYLAPVIRMFLEKEGDGEKKKGADWYGADGGSLDVERLLVSEDRHNRLSETERASWTTERPERVEGADLQAALPDIPQKAPKRLVISFASENFKHLESIKEALSNYELDGTVQVLYDDAVIDGRSGWDEDIQEMFSSADGYLILASLQYQNVGKHKYIWDKEVPLMKRRHKDEKVFTYCVSVGPVKYNSILAELPVYKGGKVHMPESGHAREAFLVDLAESIIEKKFLKDDED
ncbi:MAG: hypothetical protein H6591_02500 [Flavobacteriales bacterium]|nr:hypothetical protein [Flavobacteriales bacterium]